MYKYLPDYITKNIFEMNLDKLASAGVKGIAVDIDNTLVPMNVKEPGEKAEEWIKKVKRLGFDVCLLSNARKHRTRLFMIKLGVNGIWMAGKPGKRGYYKAAAHMGLGYSQCAILGDQLFTDIKGGRKVGFVTVLTEFLDSEEILWVKFKRRFEKRILKKYGKEIERI